VIYRSKPPGLIEAMKIGVIAAAKPNASNPHQN
jgi:hypothetical protein